MNPDCQRHQEALLEGAAPRDHVAGCEDCTSYYATLQCLAPPHGLVTRTLDRLRPALAARAARRRAIFWRLTLAGAFSLPIIIALNASMLWMTHAAVERLTTPELAVASTSVMAAILLLALSIAYGSLPLLANWGLHLRERTA